MRRQIWLLALTVLAVLACAKEEPRGPNPVAAAPRQAPYTLEVTFEGLVGYVNTKDGVWALLPKARTDTQPPSMPPGVDPQSPFYPQHFAVLEVNGANVK